MNVPQVCLKCRAPLRHGTLRVECPACGAHWPREGGIPSYGSASYHADVPNQTLRELVALAEKGHWLAAARAMFRNSNPELYDYVADLSRASWIPILPIEPSGTVLDISSGLGALTHALALHYQHVVSVEANVDMLRFSRVRLEQEGLEHVDLIQTTLAGLPFSTGTFDLIILNGVLEWVREWHTSRTSREAQLAVLSDLRRLLKPGGVLVVGSENRFGYTSLLRRRHHPRVRAMSLRSSWMGALYRRFEKPGFYRPLQASTKGDGPYTQSPTGYRALLREAGFPVAELWWPASGLNSPHTMLRASKRGLIRSYCDFDRRYKDRFHGHALARQLRHWVVVDTNLIHRMFPDVIMITAPLNEHGEQVEAKLPLLEAFVPRRTGERCHADVLTTHPYKNKTVLTVVCADTDTHAVVKLANVRLPGAETVRRSYDKLQRLHATFKARDPSLADSIPAPRGLVRVGSVLATMESSARGSRLVDLVLERRYFHRRDRVRRHLEWIVSWLLASRSALDAVGLDGAIDAIPREWLIAPDRDASAGRSAPERCAGLQHGDFYPENIFIDEESQRLCVIDWDGCATGYPPLFDWFCLVTGLYYTHQRVGGLARGQTVEFASFCQTYFEGSWFSELILSLTHRLCDGLGLNRGSLLEYFGQYIVVRYRQFQSQSELAEKHYWGPLNKDLYEQYYQFTLKNQAQCCFWQSPAVREKSGPFKR